MKAYENTQRDQQDGRTSEIGSEAQVGSVESGEGKGGPKVEAPWGFYNNGPRKGQPRLSPEDERVLRNKKQLESHYANRDERLKKSRAIRQKDPAKANASSAASCLRHPDRLRKYQIGYRERNREKINLRSRLWRENNRDRVKENSKSYSIKNAERVKASSSLKKARKKKASIGDTKPISEWIRRIKSNETVNCYWCRILFPSAEFHIDHIHPLSKGGLHSIENLCASCPKCNMAKHNKDLSDWNKHLEQPVLL